MTRHFLEIDELAPSDLTDLLDLAAPLFEQWRGQESEVSRKKEIILKFVG